MTPEQIKAIQESFAKVAPISEQAAALFYGRLFEIAPAVKPLFRGDMEEQGRKLMATLAVVVNGLGNLEAILPAASALAKRHVDYGVKAGRLRTGRRGAAVDVGTRSWRAMDAGARGGLGSRLWRALRVHDRRGLWPQRRGRMKGGAMSNRRRAQLVVVGNGMAGMRAVEELLSRAPDRFDITVIGAEATPNYNRILLSSVLAGDKTLDEIVINPRSWYDEHGIRLIAGNRADGDRSRRRGKSHSPTGRSFPTTNYCWRPGRSRWRRRSPASGCPTCAPSATSPMSRR